MEQIGVHINLTELSGVEVRSAFLYGKATDAPEITVHFGEMADGAQQRERSAVALTVSREQAKALYQALGFYLGNSTPLIPYEVVDLLDRAREATQRWAGEQKATSA